jgi:hypothetical protein
MALLIYFLETVDYILQWFYDCSNQYSCSFNMAQKMSIKEVWAEGGNYLRNLQWKGANNGFGTIGK